MDSTECRICSSSARVLCNSYPSTQGWSEQTHKSQGDCLAKGCVSSLPEEPFTDFTQSCLFDLGTLWGQFGLSEKQKFRKTYTDIASLISVTPRPEKESTHGNRRVSSSGTQFPRLHPRTRKAKRRSEERPCRERVSY